jgi:hypothetical protein
MEKPGSSLPTLNSEVSVIQQQLVHCIRSTNQGIDQECHYPLPPLVRFVATFPISKLHLCHGQVFNLALIIQEELQEKWGLNQIGSIFDINNETVHQIRVQRIIDDEGCIGHPALLASNEGSEMREHRSMSLVRDSSFRQHNSASTDAKGSENIPHVDQSGICLPALRET